MWYEEVKVYHDGSHYVGIPHTTNPKKCKKQPPEQEFEVEEEPKKTEQKTDKTEVNEALVPSFEEKEEQTETAAVQSLNEESKEKPVIRKVTRLSEFNRLYDESRAMKKGKRKAYLKKHLRRYFKSDIAAESYVEKKLQDRRRALLARRIRFTRKANMHGFNYFVTFTYDDKKHTEETFKKRLLKSLQNFHTRKGWKYMGVWERAPKSGRLHFHGLLLIPEGTMPGELIKEKDYSLNTHRMQTTVQNTYFNKQFGRNDFEEVIRNPTAYAEAVGYILKYIEKTGERLVYSRGTPTYLLTDINGRDVLAKMGEEEEKLLLADNFGCWDRGRYLGRVNDGGKERARKKN